MMATPYGAGWESPAKPPTVAEQSVEKQKALNAAGIPSTIDQCVTVSPDRSPLPEDPIALTLGDGGIGAVLSTYMLYQIPQGYVESAQKLGLTEVSITGGNLVGVGRTINPKFFDCSTQ